MKQQDPFFIGYADKIPKRYKKKMLPLLYLAFVVLAFTAWVVAGNQGPFSDNRFELGNLREMEGVLVADPVPMLIPFSDSTHREWASKGVLLLGFGKCGAEATIEAMENKVGRPLYGAKVQLRGTLIYGEGMACLELTEGADALLDYELFEQKPDILNTPADSVGTYTLVGEVIDPKCYFGVMKPATGKPHRCCAIRCLSGGIPAVLRAESNSGAVAYFLLKDAAGTALPKKWLQVVADPLQVTGQVEQLHGWSILYTDLDAASVRLLLE